MNESYKIKWIIFYNVNDSFNSLYFNKNEMNLLNIQYSNIWDIFIKI